MDVRELQRLDPSAKTDKRIAELLKKKEPFKSKYTMETGYLRKLVGKAQDHRFNPMVEYSEDEDFLEFLAKRRREKSGVSVEMASSLIEKLVEDQIEESVAAFKKRWEDQGRTWNDVREEIVPEISHIVRAHLTGKDAK